MAKLTATEKFLRNMEFRDYIKEIFQISIEELEALQFQFCMMKLKDYPKIILKIEFLKGIYLKY